MQQGLLGARDPRRRAAAGAQPVASTGRTTTSKSLSFTFDKEKKELPIVFIQEPISKVPIPIPIPDVTPLNPPLGVVPPLPPKITFLNDTAKLNPLAAAMRGLAYAGQHSDSVFGTGSLDVARYGHVLRSRQLVGVRGAGEAFDGLHYVASVTSTLKRGEFTQSFSLARNALLSTLPVGARHERHAGPHTASTASTAARSSTTSTRCRSAGSR